MNNNFGNKEQGRFSWVFPLILIILYILMTFVGYVKNSKEFFKGFSDKTLLYSGALNGDSPLFRIFTSSFLQSSLYIFIVTLLLLILTWIYVEKLYGFGLYVTSYILLTILTGLITIYITPDHITASSVAIMAGLTGMIIAAYTRLKEQDIMIITVINIVIIITSLFIPGHEAINIVATIIMLILGIGIGFLAMLASDKMAEIEESNRYKQRVKEEEKARREQERLDKQREKIRKKHKK